MTLLLLLLLLLTSDAFRLPSWPHQHRRLAATIPPPDDVIPTINDDIKEQSIKLSTVSTSQGIERCVLVGCLDNSLAAKKAMRQQKVGRYQERPDEPSSFDDKLDIISGVTPKDGPPVPSRSGTSYAELLSTSNTFTLEESLDELSSLCETAGLKPVGRVTQLISDVQPRTYIGKGKIEEIKAAMTSYDPSSNDDDDADDDESQKSVCTVVFDVDLSPRQMKYERRE